jgi:pilus assembly protein CpaB
MQDAKRRAIIFAILSVVLAGIAGYLFLDELSLVHAELGQYETVYVAARDIPTREPLSPSDFEPKKVPVKFIQRSMVTDLKGIENTVSVVPLEKGDPLTANVLKRANEFVSGDNRMVVLSQTDRVSFDGAMQANDRVDIVVSAGSNENPKTIVFLKDVRVVWNSKDYKSIGVELTLEEAKELIHQQNFAVSIRVLKAPQKQSATQTQSSQTNEISQQSSNSVQ